jgi:hypothetical protein
MMDRVMACRETIATKSQNHENSQCIRIAKDALHSIMEPTALARLQSMKRFTGLD